MPLPYRTLWSYIRYTLYFIAYTPFRLPRSPRPTPISRIPTLFGRLQPLLFGSCMHLAFLEARILCRWRSHSASSLSLFVRVLERSTHALQCPAVSSAPRPVFVPHRRPRGKRETFFRGITFIARPYVSSGPRYYPLINCHAKKDHERKNHEPPPGGGKNSNRRRDRFRHGVYACAGNSAESRVYRQFSRRGQQRDTSHRWKRDFRPTLAPISVLR